jgi:uncharacterized membrane protein YadS
MAGANGFLYTLIGIAMGIGLGVFFGKRLKVPRNAAYLVSVGTSICGGSAIAAAAPVLKAKPQDIALASATVFSLNAIALWVFPVIGRCLGFSELEFGYWAALGIHDTSSVVGASMAYGEEALEIGTTVKLARALWIVPVTLFLAWFVAEKEEGENRKFKLKVPWFIPWFIAAAALVTWLPMLIPAAADAVSTAGNFIKNISNHSAYINTYRHSRSKTYYSTRQKQCDARHSSANQSSFNSIFSNISKGFFCTEFTFFISDKVCQRRNGKRNRRADYCAL